MNATPIPGNHGWAGVCLAVSMALSTMAVAGSPTLDGRAFEVEMLPEGADQPVANTLTFHNGTFLSAVCVDHDFPQADYRVTEIDGKVRFEVHADSYSKGHMIWEGTVEADRLQATAIWHRPDREDPIRFSVQGEARSQ